MGHIPYTGVGSRSTPDDVLAHMTTIARVFANSGYLLRSGGADGADSAFEKGCNQSFGEKEIFLPWRGFNGNRSLLWQPSEDAFRVAEQLYGEQWRWLRSPIKRLHARNVHQVLGRECDSPSKLLICWTPKGALEGGTRIALLLAQELEVPVVNLALETGLKKLKAEFNL